MENRTRPYSVPQAAGIAVDESKAYFGIYSFQELEAYKSKKRYVTFVEISNFSLTYKDNYESGSRIAGAALLGLIVTAPIGIPLLSQPYYTTMYCRANCNIYVYDTVSRTIIYNSSGNDELDIRHSDTFKGIWWKTPEMEKDEIRDYYGMIIANEVLEKYQRVAAFLKARD